MLLSGGGSANWIAPAKGVSFAQKQQVNRALLRSGAPIGEINTVRKHLSRIKGGRLARAGQRAEIVTLAISDVPHDDPARSRPDRPCRIRPRCRTPARWSRNTASQLDDAIRAALDDVSNESCKPGDAAFARAQFELIARPRASLDAAIKLARRGRLRRSSISAPTSRARPATSPPITRRLALQARAERQAAWRSCPAANSP